MLIWLIQDFVLLAKANKKVMYSALAQRSVTIKMYHLYHKGYSIAGRINVSLLRYPQSTYYVIIFFASFLCSRSDMMKEFCAGKQPRHLGGWKKRGGGRVKQIMRTVERARTFLLLNLLNFAFPALFSVWVSLSNTCGWGLDHWEWIPVRLEEGSVNERKIDNLVFFQKHFSLLQC